MTLLLERGEKGTSLGERGKPLPGVDGLFVRELGVLIPAWRTPHTTQPTRVGDQAIQHLKGEERWPTSHDKV